MIILTEEEFNRHIKNLINLVSKLVKDELETIYKNPHFPLSLWFEKEAKRIASYVIPYIELLEPDMDKMYRLQDIIIQHIAYELENTPIKEHFYFQSQGPEYTSNNRHLFCYLQNFYKEKGEKISDKN